MSRIRGGFRTNKNKVEQKWPEKRAARQGIITTECAENSIRQDHGEPIFWAGIDVIKAVLNIAIPG